MLPENRRQTTKCWIAGAAVAIVAHAAVAAGFMMGSQFSKPRPTTAAMVVDLASIATVVADPIDEIPSGPPPLESRPLPAPQRLIERPQFGPAPEIKWDTPPEPLVEELKPEEQDELISDPPPAVATTALQSSVSPDDNADAVGEGAAGGDSDDPERTWERTLLAHLERNKRYPRAAQRLHQEDMIYVRFAIDRAGKVLEYAIERSRGYPLLDQEVAALIERSSPLPPPPEAVEGERVELVAPVEFFLRKVARN